jgi:hypothetical protein
MAFVECSELLQLLRMLLSLLASCNPLNLPCQQPEACAHARRRQLMNSF